MINVKFPYNEDATRAAITELGGLPDGWHFGEGTAASRAAMDRALVVLAIAQSLFYRKTAVFPELGGGILFVAYAGAKDIEVHIASDGRLSLVHIDNGEVIEEIDEANLDQVRTALTSIKDPRWSSSESCIFVISTRNGNGSEAHHLRRPVQTKESQSSVRLAPWSQVATTAVTYADSMEKLRARLPSLGALTGASFQPHMYWRTPQAILGMNATQTS